MDPTLQKLRKLPAKVKMELIDEIVMFPNTESIAKGIEKASQLGVLINYNDLNEDISEIKNTMSTEPRYNQLSASAWNIELLHLVLLKPGLNYNFVDYILFQRITSPTLCLRNINNVKEPKGVSIFIDLNDARIHIHRLLNIPTRMSEFWKALPIAIAIIAAGALVAHKLQN
jgi:hypothetical protein